MAEYDGFPISSSAFLFFNKQYPSIGPWRGQRFTSSWCNICQLGSRRGRLRPNFTLTLSFSQQGPPKSCEHQSTGPWRGQYCASSCCNRCQLGSGRGWRLPHFALSFSFSQQGPPRSCEQPNTDLRRGQLCTSSWCNSCQLGSGRRWRLPHFTLTCFFLQQGPPRSNEHSRTTPRRLEDDSKTHLKMTTFYLILVQQMSVKLVRWSYYPQRRRGGSPFSGDPVSVSPKNSHPEFSTKLPSPSFLQTSINLRPIADVVPSRTQSPFPPPPPSRQRSAIHCFPIAVIQCELIWIWRLAPFRHCYVRTLRTHADRRSSTCRNVALFCERERPFVNACVPPRLLASFPEQER